MKPNSLRRSAPFAGLALLAVLVSGCNQQQNAQHETAARGGGRHGIRAACADDIQKFCANEEKKKRCLKENMDKLSDTCKAALAQHRGGNKDNQNSTGDNDKD
jgi:hypothetical protein